MTRQTCRRATFAAILAIAALPGALRAESAVLAVSRTHHAKVLADGVPAWCAPALHLRLQLEPDSPDLNDIASQGRLLSRLKTPIETECKLAREATAVTNGLGTVSTAFTASAAAGWIFTPVPTPVAPAPPAAPVTAAVTPRPAAAAPTPPASPTKVPPANASAAAQPIAPDEDAPFVTPRDIGYPSLFVALAHQHPELLADQAGIRYWAQYRYRNQYNRLANQEFKLQPLLAQARQDLTDTVAATPPRIAVVALRTQFGEYDFAHHRFPIRIDGTQMQLGEDPCCPQSDIIPRAVTLSLSGLDAIDSLPMTSDAAERFAESRSRYGSIDRQIVLLLTVQFDDSGILPGQYGQTAAKGTVLSADIVTGQRLETLVHRFPPGQLAALRTVKAARDAEAARQVEAQRQAQAREAERQQREAAAAAAAQQREATAAVAAQQAELTRQQLLSQRQYLITALQSEPEAARLRDFMLPGATATSRSLDSARRARSEALLVGRPVPVVMLVRADSSGTANVATAWPGHLAISPPSGAAPLASGTWYLVSGQLSVPPGDDLPAAQLHADALFACARNECADAAEPAAIVQRKMAAAGLSASTPP